MRAKGRDAALSEIGQLHDRKCFKPINPKDLRREETKKVLEAIITNKNYQFQETVTEAHKNYESRMDSDAKTDLAPGGTDTENMGNNNYAWSNSETNDETDQDYIQAEQEDQIINNQDEEIIFEQSEQTSEHFMDDPEQI